MPRSASLPSPSGSLVLAVAVVLGALACLDSRGVDAITCYDCNSEYDPRCGDPFDPYTLGQIDCNERQALDHLSGANATLCRKLVQKIGLKVRVVRTCGYIEDAERDGGCVSRSGTHDVNVLYCSCKGNLCNAAPRLRLSGAQQLLLVFAAAVGAAAGAAVADRPRL
ncbi:Protein quiver [Frankliniella fusca]|uniref:Protein quiver n=1 Tax=Frankliniella fusca TaxID=407009 RepID=A0AAE1LKN2_9NEOP|nr:Protein quiver [Frankliniella fusca]